MFCTLYESFLNFIFPPRCPVCRSYQEKRGMWCPACLSRTARMHRLPMDREMYRVLASVQAVGHYHGALRKLIGELKYKKNKSSLDYIHVFLTEALRLEQFGAIDAVVPVPLYKNKQKKRGFNQAELIFRSWSETQGYQWLNALERVRSTVPQYQLHVNERRKNMKGAFVVKYGMELRGKNILLVDDILTTGSTLRECAIVLKQAGADEIRALVLASDKA